MNGIRAQSNYLVHPVHPVCFSILINLEIRRLTRSG